MEKVALESVTPAGQQPKPAWSMRPAGCRSANRCCAIEAPCVHARVEVPHPHPAPPQLPLVVFDFVVVGTLRRALPPEQRAKCPGSSSTVTPVLHIPTSSVSLVFSQERPWAPLPAPHGLGSLSSKDAHLQLCFLMCVINVKKTF